MAIAGIHAEFRSALAHMLASTSSKSSSARLLLSLTSLSPRNLRDAHANNPADADRAQSLVAWSGSHDQIVILSEAKDLVANGNYVC